MAGFAHAPAPDHVVGDMEGGVEIPVDAGGGHPQLELFRGIGTDADLDLVEAGAILHDVGRSKTQGIYHAIAGAEILKEHGFSPELVKIIERHIGAGIPKDEAILLGLPPKDYLPISLEEKIIAHADNLIHGTEEVSIDFVLQKWRKSMGEDHPSLRRLVELHRTFF